MGEKEKSSEARRRKRSHRETLPIRRKTERGEHSSSSRRKSDISHGKSIPIPEIRISAPAPLDTESDEEEDEPFISIGIDFGTTYSGVAWALSTSPSDIMIISDWPSHLPANSDNHKVPTVLTYDHHGNVNSWGYKLNEDRYFGSWFKLLLSQDATAKFNKAQPARAKELRDLMKKYKKEPLDIVADYLRCLWKHAEREIARKTVGLWEYAKLKITLTVPAIWDLAAQELTRDAAKLAGLLERESTTLNLIGEPEAAALSVFEEMRRERWHRMKKDDIFVICDAGGGTVDLISYNIEGLRPLKLGMCLEATGGFCGAFFVDGAFEAQVQTMMSEQDYANIRTKARRKMMNHWEFGIKRRFDLTARKNKSWNVDIPNFPGVEMPPMPSFASEDRRSMSSDMESNVSMISCASLRSDPGSLVLKTDHLHAIFAKTCSNIQNLIQDQVIGIEEIEGRKPRDILLVGGFGECRYLQSYLKRPFADMNIRSPTKAWAAICRGAVIKGLGSDAVQNHFSQYNYGTTAMDNPERDVQATNPDGAPVTEEHRCEWFLEKGTDIDKSVAVEREFYYPIRTPEELLELVCTIVYSATMRPEAVVGPGVRELCKLKMSFDPAIFEDLPIKRNEEGDEWRELDFVLEMRISSGEICWTTRYKGVNKASISNALDDDDEP